MFFIYATYFCDFKPKHLVVSCRCNSALLLCDKPNQQTVRQTGWWRSDVALSSFLSHIPQDPPCLDMSCSRVSWVMLYIHCEGSGDAQRNRPADCRSDQFHLSPCIRQHVWPSWPAIQTAVWKHRTEQWWRKHDILFHSEELKLKQRNSAELKWSWTLDFTEKTLKDSITSSEMCFLPHNTKITWNKGATPVKMKWLLFLHTTEQTQWNRSPSDRMVLV